jgi:hypothetical protein
MSMGGRRRRLIFSHPGFAASEVLETIISRVGVVFDDYTPHLSIMKKV